MKIKYIIGILMFLIIAVGTASATPTIITLDNNENVNFEHATVTYTPDVTYTDQNRGEIIFDCWGSPNPWFDYVGMVPPQGVTLLRVLLQKI